MEKSTFKSLRIDLDRKLREIGLNAYIGQEFSYKSGSVKVIPIRFNPLWYGTIQIQGNQLRARLSKVGYRPHTHVVRLDTLHTDDMGILMDMITNYVGVNVA